MVYPILPLEKVFFRVALDKARFPQMSLDYVVQYQGFVNYLRADIYGHIDVGLAANSNAPGYYTAHNAEHFDEVVRYAGELLGVITGDESVSLEPYELYILLVAIRIHDIGNIKGRDDHEKQCFPMLRSFGAVAGSDTPEKKIIADIAQAHGGRTGQGSKDTIGALDHKKALGKFFIRPRLIASIVRFADEICESRNRAANYLLAYGSVPTHSQLFHRYAAGISASVVSFKDRRITLAYRVTIEDISIAWGCAITGDKTSSYLIDEILERLEKMDRERRYCNRFSRELYTIDAIRATIEIVDEDHNTIHTIQVPELHDTGYPEDQEGRLKDQLRAYCGPEFPQKLIVQSEGSQDDKPAV